MTAEPSGFFVLRTPLLSFETLQRWGDDLAAARAAKDPALLAEAIVSDTARLRERLAALVSRPEVRDALFVASPSLEESLAVWRGAPASERGQDVERALVRYVSRMAGRATPFGLFAGVSVGRIGAETRLATLGQGRYARHTRLDMDYLVALADEISRQGTVAMACRYRPNSSLYRVAGQLRYVECRWRGSSRFHHLVALEPDAALEATLDRAAGGATRGALAEALVDDEATRDEANAFVDELVASQVLVPDLQCAITGLEPLQLLEADIRRHGDTATADVLADTRSTLHAIDAAGPGVAPARYRAVAQSLEALPATVDLTRLFQVDLVKPAPDASLGQAVVDDLLRAVDLLRGITHRASEGHDELTRFRDAFLRRYDGREVPLVEVLDEEAGIGPWHAAAGADASPLLRDLELRQSPDETTPWNRRWSFLLARVGEVLGVGGTELNLTTEDLVAMRAPAPLPLPDAFEVLASVAGASEAAVRSGDCHLLVRGVSGPSGARLLGRFCHADATLAAHVRQHVTAEEALDPDAVFAEVVHLPEGRLGNILLRPILRPYEIPYLGRSGAPCERQLPIADLMVSVVAGTVVLRSRHLNRRLIPRLTSAHNYLGQSVGIYRFLCLLQGQGVAGSLAWDWGVLGAMPFLPRVTAGRIVLSLARWRAGRLELRRLGEARGVARVEAVRAWRAARRMPRWVALADADNLLPIDLENVLCIESFVHLVKGRDEATFLELVPGADEHGAHGPEGRFVHEIVVPFVRSTGAAAPRVTDTTDERGADERRNPAPSRAPGPAVRVFPPGSEWVYAKLYTGTVTADRVLREVVGPVSRAAERGGWIDRWFFIRYGDPDWHLRWRLRGSPERLREHVRPAIEAAVESALADGRLWRVVLDTYQPEVERYGGPGGIDLAEQVFHADSEAVLDVVDGLDGDAGADVRWRLALPGIDRLLADLGLDLRQRLAVIEHARAGFLEEWRAGPALKRQLSARFRTERRALEALFDGEAGASQTFAQGFTAFARRSDRLRHVAAELNARERASGVTTPLADLASSHVHMHVNRLLRSDQRAHELVLYDFLARLYRAALHRT